MGALFCPLCGAGEKPVAAAAFRRCGFLYEKRMKTGLEKNPT